ncbi:hypothetical protein [Bacillus toyonensis]|uniref:hypothetical protein n=1 Tax=Bacillus toyonensis TaxID=155322 RepID=UPI000BFD5E31|nr:hypothetical protein [Bacillus toyonensis]PHF07236.1 hypothetical protein COF83_31105 [Bacillus toyonensis]PHF42987.1 hypothetical protein COI39_20130 [Bacillus toyonensis]
MADVTKIECKDGNIYEVNGKRYRELAKEPAVGDMVLVIKPQQSIDYEKGDVLILTDANVERGDYGFVDKVGDENGLYRDEFVIVEPIEQADGRVFVSLSSKVTRLEERTEENHRNVLTFSQMAESARSDASKAIGGVNALDEQLELVREDIVFLDEKISALEETKTPQNFTININVLDIESAKAIVESITKGRE